MVIAPLGPLKELVVSITRLAPSQLALLRLSPRPVEFTLSVPSRL